MIILKIYVLVISMTLMSAKINGLVNVLSMNELSKSERRDKKIKCVLIWTSPEADPIKNLGVGQETFLQKNCAQTNCFITSNRKFKRNVSNFDTIIFHGPELVLFNELPSMRSPHQIYVFASMESPLHSPICDQKVNTLFNCTWTYKLKSDILYGYIIIKDKAGNFIGPKKNMNWKNILSMQPTNKTLKVKLDGKYKAAAWFVSNCRAWNNRRQIASDIKEELEKYGFTLDVFGKCGWMSCEKDSTEKCSKLIEKHYYFYLSFENSISEDYVTEKLLHALNNLAVPVVYGGANYTRFMPDGIYLNARTLDVEDLVKQMVYLINNKEKYYNYFRWHNYYSYHEPTEFPETDPYCNLCAAINDEERLRRPTIYGNFKEWWNEPHMCQKYEG